MPTTETTGCRRCSECKNSRHHWLDSDEFAADSHDGTLGPSHSCKHCGATGKECPECGGDGNSGASEEECNENPKAGWCPCCNGEGVIEWTDIDELDEINQLCEPMTYPGQNDHERELHRLGFLEGRAFEITRRMEQHPEWWHRVCGCRECCEE